MLTTGNYPDILKVGKVIPVHKTGSKKVLNNYRPITLTSVFSKIIEIILKNRINNFMEKNLINDKYQYGFTKKSSTLCTTTDLINYVTTNLDHKLRVGAVFVDLSKAFDIVNHQTLLSKLYKMGIRGNAYRLISSFLNNRKQYVFANNTKSNPIINKHGVPQGTVLGPLLYSIYVLNLKVAQLNCRYFSFADDTVLLYTGRTVVELEHIINQDLDRYFNWLIQNKLKINLEKTSYMLFRQKNNTDKEMNICINEEKIKQVNFIRYLGLIIDDTISWKLHVDSIINKIAPMVCAIYKYRNCLNYKAKLRIYNTYHLSIIRYQLPLWGICKPIHFKKIESLQNKILKIMFNINYLTPTKLVYKILDVYPIKEVLYLEQYKLAYRVINSLVKCNTAIRYVKNVHVHNTRNYNNVYLVGVRLEIALNDPLNRSIQLYNSLPDGLKRISDFAVFLKNLESYMKMHNSII